jgi:malate synthase
MFLELDEMKSVLYEYQMNEIAENDAEIIEDGIVAAVAEVRSYFEAANNRRNTADNVTTQQATKWKLYDTDAIFATTGNDRNKFVLRLCKRIAAWNICELANMDAPYDHLRQRYEDAIKTLEKIAGMGEYKDAPLTLSDLPSLPPEGGANEVAQAFRSGSREKFNHE